MTTHARPAPRTRSRAGALAVGAWTLAVALMATALAVAPAAEADTRRIVGGWVPYWTTASSVASFTANQEVFSDLSPFWHSATGDTTIIDQDSPADRSAVISAARAAGVPVVPAVTDGTPAGFMAALLADPTRRAKHVQALVDLAVSRGYDGIDLDYEGFAFRDGKASWAATRGAWVQFTADLGGALRARSKLLFVAIPPTYNSNRDASSGYWVYDYAGIAPHVDRVRIMAYDYSVSAAGPIAPIGWVRSIVGYAVTQIPSLKVQLGVPTYGRDWVTITWGICPPGADTARRTHTAAQALALAAAKGVTPAWDATAEERRFDYQEVLAGGGSSCTVNRTVWFSDASAVSARVALADQSRLGGVAFWTVGGEDPNQWAYVKATAAGSTGPQPFRPFGSLDAVSGGRGQLTATGWAIDPDTTGPVSVVLTIDGVSYLAVATQTRPDVGAAFPGYGSDHGFTITLPARPGSRTVCAYATNIGPGASTTLGCRQAVVTNADPIGNPERVAGVLGGIEVSGWALDPDSADPLHVQVWVDGALRAFPLADLSRPDVGTAFPGAGDAHGFALTVPAWGGQHSVCVAANNVGPGNDASLGCRTVAVPGGTPFGNPEQISRAGSTISVSGWVIDPDTAGPAMVQVWLDGRLAAYLAANAPRADVGAAFPSYGPLHGYRAAVPAGLGPHTVCVAVANVGAGVDARWPCRTV